MINKYETIGILASVSLMALALFLLRVDNTGSLAETNGSTQPASLAVVTEGASDTNELYNTVSSAVNKSGEVEKLVIDDVQIGTGIEVKDGDTVTVNYIGTLTNGQQFDNSYNHGTPFTFTVGDGKVIAGWETGLIGMKEGGKRILVVPASMAYGKKAVGPIPANSTLIFSIELLSVSK